MCLHLVEHKKSGFLCPADPQLGLTGSQRSVVGELEQACLSADHHLPWLSHISISEHSLGGCLPTKAG